MQVSRSVAAKRFLGQAVVGASLLAVCLQAGAASALSFTFSFSGIGIPSDPGTVTGIVEGLVDNTNDQRTGLTVAITSTTNGPLTVFTDADYDSGDGFDVALGQVTGVDIYYLQGFLELYLGNQGQLYPEYRGFNANFESTFDTFDSNSFSSNSLVFTPFGPGPVSVPGPLPIFGAGAAFGWSRRLRRRIKTPV